MKPKKLKKEAKSRRKRSFTNSSFIVTIVLLILLVFYLSFIILTLTKQTQEFSETLNLEVGKSKNYKWQLEQPGSLQSVKISGLIEGAGEVKVYLDDLLILDSSKLSKTKLTGYVTESTEEALEETISEEIQEQPTESPSQLAVEETQTSEEIQEPTETIQEQPTNQTNEIPEETIINEQLTETTEIEPIKEFKDVCEQTCNLSDSLNKSSYTLKIEIDNATLKLEKIKYEIVLKQKENISEINKTTLINITTFENLTKTTVTSTTTKQYKAVIGKPVKWTKQIKLKTLGTAKTTIPKQAENVSVSKIISKTEKLTTQETKIKQEAKFSVTAKAIQEQTSGEKPILNSIINFLKKTFLTGRAITEEPEEIIEITIEDNATEYEIEYYTEAPQAFEAQISEREKIITISGPDELNYTDILAYTELPIESPAYAIKLYHVQDVFKREVEIDKYDLNENSLIDYIEWTVPHLSNQTYELIIEIAKAEHLDENKQLISDIYEEVKERDNIWSETINNNEYVRVVFEQNLTKTRDITIYAKSINDKTAKIEVYRKDDTEILAVFENIQVDRKYKIYLTNLSEGEEQDTFDLKIIGETGVAIKFDYIVDPSECTGTADDCTGMDEISCGNQDGCSWVYASPTYICADDPGATPCTDFYDDTSCNGQSGCSWSWNDYCNGAWISCPSSVGVNSRFTISYGATAQSDPNGNYPTTSLSIYRTSPTTNELRCNEWTSDGDEYATGNYSVNVTETNANSYTYRARCYASSSTGNCGSSDSSASCTVTITMTSQSNITLNSGWNLISMEMQNTDTGTDRSISVSSGWNLIGFSSDTPEPLSDVLFSGSSWSSAVSAGQVQAYLAYLEDGQSKYVATSGMHDNSLRRNKGYWLSANQAGTLTLGGVGGTLANEDFDWKYLKLNNGTDTKNMTDARDAGWIFMSGDPYTYYRDSSGYKTVCEDAPSGCKTDVSSWEGYFIWSNYDNLKVLREN